MSKSEKGDWMMSNREGQAEGWEVTKYLPRFVGPVEPFVFKATEARSSLDQLTSRNSNSVNSALSSRGITHIIPFRHRSGQ